MIHRHRLAQTIILFILTAIFHVGCASPATTASLQKAWWKDMLEMVKDPSRLDPILDSLTGLAQSAK